MVTGLHHGVGVGLSGSRRSDWLAVGRGRREVSVAVEEERDERMDGRLQREEGGEGDVSRRRSNSRSNSRGSRNSNRSNRRTYRRNSRRSLCSVFDDHMIATSS